MPQDKALAKHLPSWTWVAFCPVVGGFAFIYAGQKINQTSWIYTGIGFAAISVLTWSISGLATFVWLGQIGLALYWKEQYLQRQAKPDQISAPLSTKLGTIDYKGKVDINTCTKDELVYRLGLPIVYANEIIELRESGLVFTHVEELSELGGLPEQYLDKIGPQVTFTYDLKRESLEKWENINFFSEDDLMTAGLSAEISQKLVQERLNSGHYKSLLDVTRRTKIPIKYLQRVL